MISSILRSGDAPSSGSTSTFACLIDVCSAGIVGQWYTFNAGDQVTDQIGGGRGADLVLAYLSNAPGPVYFTPAAPTWGGAPSVSHAGSGPAVTVALAPGASGPYDDFQIVGTITQGGANGTAMIAWAYDGQSQIEAMPVPSEGAAQLVGSAPITPTTLGTASSLTLVFDQPAAKTLTLPTGSLVAVAAGLKAATATSASPVTLTASDLLTAGKAAVLANPRRLRFTTAGVTASDAPANVVITGTDYAGATQTETLVLAQTATTATSVKAYATIASLAYPAADGTGATVAVGYEDAYSSVAEIVVAFNFAAAAAPLAVAASDSQTTSGHFLAFTTTSAGAGVSLTFDASPGTAATLFGFTANETSTGTAATLALPWTGLVTTFAVDTYELGDTYTIRCFGPSASISAITAAMAVGRANWRTTPFGFFAVTAPPSNAANAAGLQAACTSTVSPWRADNSCPVWCMTGTQFHTASAVPTTNAANILSADNAISSAFAGNPAALDLVAVDDCYVGGSSNLRTGTFRRSAVIAAAIRRASLPKLGSDIAEGIVPGITLRSPDGATLARDEFYSTVKLGPAAGGLSGPGFAVMKSTSAGVSAPKFAAGVTRAGSTSQFRFSHAVVVALEISQTAFARATTWEGQTWPTDPSNGHLLESEAQQRADDVYNDLIPLLLPEGKDPSVSGQPVVTIDTSGVFQGTGAVPLGIKFIPLGLVRDLTITVTAQGTIQIAP